MSNSTDSKCIRITDADFDSLIKDSKVPVVVDFYAEWCGPCRSIAPLLEKLAADFEGRLVIAKINVDENSQVADRLKVKGLPTMLFYCNGERVDEQVGAPQYSALRAKIEKVIGACHEGECSAAETEFRETVAAADAAFHGAIAEPQAEVMKHYGPISKTCEAATRLANEQFERGEIDKTKRDELIAAAEQARDQAIAPHLAPFQELFMEADGIHRAAITAALERYNSTRC